MAVELAAGRRLPLERAIASLPRDVAVRSELSALLGISAVPYDQTVEIPIRDADGVLIRFSFSGRPIERYAVLLLVFRDGRWQEVRVYDNHLCTHHLHRYSRTGGKQDAEPFHPGPTTAALPAAIQHLKDGWENIILSWEQ